MQFYALADGNILVICDCGARQIVQALENKSGQPLKALKVNNLED